MTQVKRRSFLKCGLAGTAATAASLLPMAAHAQSAEAKQIGRASCRERV